MLLSTQPTINLRHGCKGQPSLGETRVLGAVIVEKQTMGRPDNLRLQIQGLYAIPLTDMTRMHPCAQKKPLCAACYVAAGVRLCEGREEAVRVSTETAHAAKRAHRMSEGLGWLCAYPR